MSLLPNLRLALTGLAVNKLRSFLTMLGIIIGVAAVITLLSVGRGVESFVTGEFEGLGNNLLFIVPGRLSPEQQPQRAGRQGLTNDDLAALSDPLRVPSVKAVVPEYGRFATISHGGEEWRAQVNGTWPAFTGVRNFHPVTGSFFSDQDVASGARLAVLGQTVYEALFPEGDIPLGQTIRINDIPFQVIALLEEKGGSGFNDQDNIVLVPLSTAQRRLFPARRSDGKLRLDIIYAQAISDQRQEQAILEIQQVLRATHQIAFRDEDDFTVLSQDDLVTAFGQVTGMITLFLVVIAGISLLVGGIGIMNIMLVSVTERTREIGLRKAVGARRRDILWQFLVEAIVLATAGGLVGLLLGLAGARLIASLSDSLRPVVAWDAVGLALVFSAGVGLFFGIYPASRAAGLNPIDALRYE